MVKMVGEKMFNKIKKLFKNNVEMNEIDLNPSMKQLTDFFDFDIGGVSSNKLTSPTYYACMLIRCNSIAKLSLNVLKESEKGTEKAIKHPLYNVLKYRPNKFMSPHDFFWATEFQRLEYGNAFWVMKEERGQIKELYLLNSTNVEIMVDNTNILSDKNTVYYIYNDTKYGQIIYTADEIVHFKSFSQNGLKGTSIRKFLSDTISNEQSSQKVLKEKYKSGLQDPIVVTYTGDLNEANKTRIKKKFADLGGAKNAGKVVPIPTDFGIKQLETKLVNNQYFELQGLTTKQIANAFGVKSFQLNDMEKSTYNNIEQQNKAFYSDTLQNVLTIYEQEIQYKLLSFAERERGYSCRFNIDVILRSDLISRTNSYVKGIQTGYMTIAEVREKERLPFIEGTDQLIIGNGASIPLELLGKQYEQDMKNKKESEGEK